MGYFNFVWNREIVEHLREHGVSQDDFEALVCHPDSKGWSRASGQPAVWGYLSDGRYVMAVYEKLDEVTILPVTAFEVPEPR